MHSAAGNKFRGWVLIVLFTPTSAKWVSDKVEFIDKMLRVTPANQVLFWPLYLVSRVVCVQDNAKKILDGFYKTLWIDGERAKQEVIRFWFESAKGPFSISWTLFFSTWLISQNLMQPDCCNHITEPMLAWWMLGLVLLECYVDGKNKQHASTDVFFFFLPSSSLIVTIKKKRLISRSIHFMENIDLIIH